MNTDNKTKELTTKYRLSNAQRYLHENISSEMNDFVEGGKIQSGYANLDAVTNLYPGFYVIGAISSLGKTTFIHQMSDQIAEAGNPVMYFSLEQSTLELVSKSLSRTMAKRDASEAMTSLQIRKNGEDQRVKDAMNEYSKHASNLWIAECTFNMTIETIEEVVANYIQQTSKKPVVVVDYLQMIQPPKGSHMTSKEVTDEHVRRLKQLQKDNGLVLIVISSLNRQNYLTQIDYESFKESGGIEYTADVMWGLQLEVLHDEIFNSQGKLNEKREKVRDAKASNPRRIELVCMKNRFGVSSYSCMFNYYPQFDYFVPILENIDLSSMETDPDGWFYLPKGFDVFRRR